MRKKFWKYRTVCRTAVYIATSDNADLDAGHTEAEITNSHMLAACEAFYNYSVCRGIQLIDAIAEVTTLPSARREVAWARSRRTDTQLFSVEATVYECSLSTEKNHQAQVSVLDTSDSDEDEIDPERNAAVKCAIKDLYEVIYTLEGVLDEEEDKYPDLPRSMRAPADGEPSGKDRLKIESAISLLYRAQRVLNHLE